MIWWKCTAISRPAANSARSSSPSKVTLSPLSVAAERRHRPGMTERRCLAFESDTGVARAPLAGLFPPELMLQLHLRPFQPRALRFRQGLAGAVDVEGQHRQGGAIGAGPAARAALRRTFEGCRDLSRTCQFENILPEIERIALLRDALRPAFWRCLSRGGLSPCRCPSDGCLP